jgi:hypothetical protein
MPRRIRPAKREAQEARRKKQGGQREAARLSPSVICVRYPAL